MRTRLVQLALVLLLVVYLCAPLFESVDHWDHFPQSGHDIVLTVLGVALCLGIALTLMRTVFRVIATKLATCGLLVAASTGTDITIFLPAVPASLVSSPPTLRI
jgi:hypothetical protein